MGVPYSQSCGGRIQFLTSDFPHCIFFFLMLLVSRLCSVRDRMINEYGEVNGMIICRGNQSTQRKPAPVYHKFCMTWIHATEVESWQPTTSWAIALALLSKCYDYVRPHCFGPISQYLRKQYGDNSGKEKQWNKVLCNQQIYIRFVYIMNACSLRD
jgi:hypothetical protein